MYFYIFLFFFFLPVCIINLNLVRDFCCRRIVLTRCVIHRRTESSRENSRVVFHNRGTRRRAQISGKHNDIIINFFFFVKFRYAAL